MSFNTDIMKYIPRKLAITLPDIESNFFSEKTEIDTLGKKERDKLAVNSLTPNEIWKFCDELESNNGNF